ncbi:MAG: hypothetical protein LLF94_06705 [Chlamydiales bacterium]|nr:hypothetical protein [Chlamydiales bacterium]
MTQILVNFLQPNTTNSTVLATDPRIFDFEISEDAQTYYNYQMVQILTGLGAQIVDSAGTAHAVTMANLNSGTIVFNGPTSATTVSDAINLLNNWSKMKSVNSSNFQTYSYGSFGTTTLQGPTEAVNTTGTIASGTPANVLVPPPDGSGVTSLTTTMDQYMAQGLDKLIRTLRAAGWDPISDPTNSANAQAAIAKVTAISTSSVYNVAGVLHQAISAAAQTHLIGNAARTDSMSIQQVLMVDYVSRGNEILFNEMQALKSAIDINQTALSYLNSLQDLMNQKDPQKFVMSLTDLNNVNINSSNPQSQYDTFEKNTYDQSLGTISRLGVENSATYQDYFNHLSAGSIGSTSPLDAQVFAALNTAANQVASYSVTTIITNLNYLASQITAQGGGSASSGLVQALNKVKSDFVALQSTNQSTAIQKWIQDTQTSDPGSFQRDLSNAIVSSQSFNDTERENLREVMFVFEEFYKSATGLLSRLTQLIEKMADGIAR